MITVLLRAGWWLAGRTADEHRHRCHPGEIAVWREGSGRKFVLSIEPSPVNERNLN